MAIYAQYSVDLTYRMVYGFSTKYHYILLFACNKKQTTILRTNEEAAQHCGGLQLHQLVLVHYELCLCDFS